MQKFEHAKHITMHVVQRKHLIKIFTSDQKGNIMKTINHACSLLFRTVSLTKKIFLPYSY